LRLQEVEDTLPEIDGGLQKNMWRTIFGDRCGSTRLVKRITTGAAEASMAAFNLHEAKTALSQLAERAVGGEEIVIAKAGKPMVKMVPVELKKKPLKRNSGQNLLGISSISDDFDAALPDDLLKGFGYE
jgi:prevent-host-death family protein